MDGKAPKTVTGDEWTNAVKKTHEILVDLAQSGYKTISYAELAAEIGCKKIGPKDRAFFSILDHVSLKEDAQGRGMLSVLVVQRTGAKIPGRGFFYLAKKLGRDVKNKQEFWAAERQRVYAAWCDHIVDKKLSAPSGLIKYDAAGSSVLCH